eukprot:5319937-Pyramimonas_sp.AAC.1
MCRTRRAPDLPRPCAPTSLQPLPRGRDGGLPWGVPPRPAPRPRPDGFPIPSPTPAVRGTPRSGGRILRGWVRPPGESTPVGCTPGDVPPGLGPASPPRPAGAHPSCL